MIRKKIILKLCLVITIFYINVIPALANNEYRVILPYNVSATRTVPLAALANNEYRVAPCYKYARYCVERLASAEFFGRGYVNHGDSLAADFIQSELDKIHVENHRQHFPISINNITHANLKLKENDSSMVIGEDYLIHGLSSGCYLSLRNHKCLVIRDKEHMQKLTSKALQGQVLLFNQTTVSQRDIISFLSQLSANKIDIKLAIIQGYNTLQYPISTSLLPYPILMLKGEKIQSKRIPYLDLEIENQYFNQYQTQNIWAIIPGSEKADSTILLLSHYDHLGMCGTAIFPGAMDNASGVSVNLDLARYFAENQPRYTIAICFTSGEEIGLKGAFYAAKHPLVDLKKVKFVLNLDMVGSSSYSMNIVGGLNHPDKAQIFKDINSEVGAFCDIVIGEGSCNSDHCPFVQQGLEAFFIFTHGKENLHYHDIGDTYQNLTLTKHIDLCNYLIDFISRLIY